MHERSKSRVPCKWMTCSQLGDSSLQSLIGFLIGGMIGLNHRDEFPMAL